MRRTIMSASICWRNGFICLSSWLGNSQRRDFHERRGNSQRRRSASTAKRFSSTLFLRPKRRVVVRHFGPVTRRTFCNHLDSPALQLSLLSGRDGSARLSDAAVPPLCGLELGRSLRTVAATVAATLETFDVVGRLGIVLIAPSLDDQVLRSAAAERACQRLGRILDRLAVRVREMILCRMGSWRCPVRSPDVDACQDLPAGVAPGAGAPGCAAGGLRMMLVAIATTEARSESSPGTTSVVLSLASLPNWRTYSSPMRSCIASMPPRSLSAPPTLRRPSAVAVATARIAAAWPSASLICCCLLASEALITRCLSPSA